MNIENKVTVITGSNGQLGTLFCKYFLDAGAKVIGLDLNIKDKNNHLDSFYEIDVVSNKNVNKIFKEIISKYGKIDILISTVLPPNNL